MLRAKFEGVRWLSLALVMLGCSGRALELDDPESSESRQGSGDLDHAWVCLPGGAMGPPPLPASDTVRYRTLFVDFASPSVVVSNATIHACYITDVSCEYPLAIAISVLNDDGVVEIPLPWGFDGWLHIQAPGYMPTDYHFLGPLKQPYQSGQAIPLMTLRGHDDLIRDLGYELDTGAGTLVLTISDCEDRPARGARLSLAAESRPGGVTWVQEETLLRAGEPPPLTDASGIAGVFVGGRFFHAT